MLRLNFIITLITVYLINVFLTLKMSKGKSSTLINAHFEQAQAFKLFLARAFSSMPVSVTYLTYYVKFKDERRIPMQPMVFSKVKLFYAIMRNSLVLFLYLLLLLLWNIEIPFDTLEIMFDAQCLCGHL